MVFDLIVFKCINGDSDAVFIDRYMQVGSSNKRSWFIGKWKCVFLLHGCSILRC